MREGGKNPKTKTVGEREEGTEKKTKKGDRRGQREKKSGGWD